MNGKGSKPRPYSSYKNYLENFDLWHKKTPEKIENKDVDIREKKPDTNVQVIQEKFGGQKLGDFIE